MEIITCNNNEIKINSYVIKQDNKAIVIDPNNYEEIITELDNCALDYIFLTHEHFDHIMAVDQLREKFNAKLIAQKYTSENIQNSSRNLSKFSSIILKYMNIKTSVPIKEIRIKKADIIFDETYILNWDNYTFNFTHTPGHSKGSSSILIDNYLFVGDSLFEFCETDIKGIGTSKKDYRTITLPYMRSLNKNVITYPGHYNSFLLWKKLNKM